MMRHWLSPFVIPAKAGIQTVFALRRRRLDPGLRRGDDLA
jgi:hypothetical protein